MKKRLLSMALVLCMILTLLPTSALAANTVTVNDYDSLKTALTSSASGTTVQLGGDISFPTSIVTANSLTLDLNGHTLTFTGTDPEKKGLMIGIRFTGVGLFTVKDSGSDGKFTASETYSAPLLNSGSGVLELSDGAIIVDKEMSACVYNTGSGTVKLSGATVKSAKFYAVINQFNTGRLTMSGGTVSSVASYALVNAGKAEISGGTVSSETGGGAINLGNSSTLTVSGGTLKSTSGRALESNGNGSTITVTSGTVRTDSGYAIIGNGKLQLSGGTVSSGSGISVCNLSGGSATISNGATVTSVSGNAVCAYESLAITGGTVSSDSGTALVSFAPEGSEVTVSGGTLSSESTSCVANLDSGKITISATATLSTVSGAVCVHNQGAGTAVINGGTLTAKTAELYNSGEGKIEINAGTYALAINNNANGKLVINGGSIKAVQGTTPINSAGTPLSLYGITLTDGNKNVVKDTAVKAGELTLTPAVSYGFNGVKTDASGTVYLWLPSDTTNAKYKTDKIDVSGGIKGGKTFVLPNFTAHVQVKFNDAVTDTPQNIYLSTKADADGSKILPLDTILADNYRSPEKGGVYLFSGLDPTKTYYVWGMVSGGTSCAKSADGTLITVKADKPIVEVNYYSLKVKAGEGIDYVFMNISQIQGTSAFVQANVNTNYTFEKWANTAGDETVLGEYIGNIKLDGPKDISAYAKLNTYDGTVTVKKDDAAWSGSGKAVTLSPSDKAADAEGFKTATSDTGSKYSFADLSPLVTYYVWMDGTCTGQTVTPTGKDAVVDYYSVTAVNGANISAVEVKNGDVVTTAGEFLKGTQITVTATANDNRVFSRWQNTDSGALVSASSPYTFTVNGVISLTAVGGATKYTAVVTLAKDDAPWTSSPRKIVLSTSASELAGTVAGTVSDNTYTFANLPGNGNYFVWDADTVTYTGKEINSTDISAALDYYTVTVDKGENVTAVTGSGEYLEGSNVTVTATLSDYCRIDTTGWTGNSLTISDIKTAKNIAVAAVLDTYDGTVTVNKDSVACPDTTAIVTVSTSGTDAEAGKLTTTGARGVFTVANLDPRIAYYIWADGAYTGRVLSRAAISVSVDYYTVSVTPTNATVTGAGAGEYLAGSKVELEATYNSGYDFVGWYSGSTLLSTNTTYTIDNLSSKQELAAKASDTFDATVVVSGVPKTITLVKDGNAPILPDGGTTGSFSTLTRGITYRVCADGVDTGKTVSKDAPSIVLSFFTVNLSAGPGISNVTGGGTYLAGSLVPISAEIVSGYTFNGWKGTASFTDLSSTISNIDKDYSLTASAYKPYAGNPFDISSGSITISDSATAEKIKVAQNGTVIADGIDPSQAITIMGTSTEANNFNVTVDATNGATIILNNLDIRVSWDCNPVAMNITDNSGDITVLLKGINKLYAKSNINNWAYGGAALRKSDKKALTIQSIDGTVTHSLTATGDGVCSTGIGTYFNGNTNVSNITINSGTINATGWGAGIGVYSGNTSGITVNGGIVTASVIGSSQNTGILSGFTVNGGTLTVGSIGAGTASNIIFKGGSLDVAKANVLVPPTNDVSPVNKVTVTTGFQKTDVSGKLTITKTGGGFSYGTKDMWTTDDANGDVFLWLPNGTYTATLGTVSKTFTVPDSDSVSLKPTYDVNIPASVTTEGVTASATASNTSDISPDSPITITVTLSGTALKQGTYTVGLTGASAGTITAPTTVTKKVAVGDSPTDQYTFTFTMPANAVSDLAVTLNFAETNKHTVSFKDGEALISSASYYEGESYPLLDGSGLKKTGYSFDGWKNGETKVSGNQTLGNADVVLSTVWKAETYSVSFGANGGTGSMSTQSFTYGGTQTLTTNSFHKDGYTFAGWRDTSGKLYADNTAISVTADMTLSAVWKAESYSVSFANGGGTGTMDSQSFNHGAPQELTPNAFTRNGYTFDGWNEGATSYVNGQSVSATKNMTLTAKWTANHYTVVYSGNGATGGTVMANQSITYDASQNLTTNTYARTGYTFAGWATSATGEKAYDNGTSVNNLTALQNDTVTLYAVWTPNTYTVNFNANNGSGSMDSQAHTYDTALALTENAFTRSGYAFSGWNTKADGTGSSFANKASVKNLTTDNNGVPLYAQWAATTYSLAFNANDGVGDMDNQSFATGDSGTVSANRFTKPGYTFAGWAETNDGAKKYNDSANLSTLENLIGANPTLYAKWTPNTYTVVFNANGGSESMGNQSFTYAQPQNLNANTFTRGSDTFLGWSTSPTAEKEDYTDGQSISNLTTMAGGTVTLYAVWMANTYDVRFAANGGSGDMLPQTIDRSTATATALSANSYIRTGYTFAKWNTQPDGSGLFYADKQEVTNLPGDTASSITLYAQWTENARYNLSGTVKDSDGLLSGATVKLMQGSTLVAQTRTGADGSFFFGNLKSGIYNLVASKGEKTVTTLVTITSHTMQHVVIPAATTNNSVLVVTNEPKAETPEVTVGGLDALAAAENADITMTVTAKAEDKDSAEQLAIKTKSGSQSVGMYLDMTVKRGIVTLGNTATVLEIVVPFSFSGKTSVKLLRYHDGAAEELEQLDKIPTAPLADGTCFLDRQAGFIHVYTSKFSTYAIAYTNYSGGGGTTTSPSNVDIVNTASGTIKVDKPSPDFGTKVTITVTPDKGYQLAGLSITDASGKQITYTNNSGGTYTFTMPNSKVTITPTFSKMDSTFPFVDVPETYWAYGDIAWAYKGGLMNGTGDGTTFEPNATTTRGMIVTVLWRMEDKPVTSAKAAFLDVTDGAYYAKAIAWAAEHKIVEGYDSSKFGPENRITREQMAAILYRYAKYKGYDVSIGANTNMISYFDAESVSMYAVSAIQWACGAGLVNGVDGKLMPQGDAERCQVAAILHRFCENVAK